MRPYLENKTKPIWKSMREFSYDFPSHFHNNLEITFCFSGEQKISIGEKEYVLKKGDAAIIFPNTPHEYFKINESPARIVSIMCNTKILSETFPDIISKYPVNPHISADCVSPNIVLGFEGIAATTENAQMIGWTYIILSDVLRLVELESLDGDRELPSRIVDYIDKNFKEPLTIEYISKAFGYHPSYIAHLFCDQLKIPFRTYLGAVRAEYAATQIRTTQKSLTEIAYDSGYNSLNTFCRGFKKHFGQTPSEYKKNIVDKNVRLD